MKIENIKSESDRFISRYAGHMVVVMLFFAVLTIVGCSKDDIGTGDDSSPVPAGYVRPEIIISVAESENIKTRATGAQEDYVNNNSVWVMVFDGTGENAKLMQYPVKSSLSGNKLYALLYATGETRYLYVVANLSANQQAYLSTVANFTEGSTTCSQVNAGLVASSGDIPATGIVVDDTNPIPMCSSTPIECKAENGGTATLNSISSILKRLVARIDVVVKPGIVSDFVIKEVRLVNGAKKTDILPLLSITANNGGTQRYSAAANGVTNMPDGGRAIASQIYLFQNSGQKPDSSPNPTTIVIKGEYKGVTGYYRIDILDSNTKVPYDIEGNKIYIVSISDVENVGYESENEAAANNPSNNIQYDVAVGDQGATDIVSNGEYYLAVSNSDLIDYSNATASDILAFTVYYDAPSSVSTATVSASGTGVALVAGTGLSTADGISGSLITPDGNTHSVDVSVRLGNGFTAGAIQVRVGNLIKKVNLVRNSYLSFNQEVITDFNTQEYVRAEVHTVTSPSWLGVSSRQEMPATVVGDVTNPLGGVFIHALPNETSLSRTGEVFIARRDDGGRVRVRIMQNGKP